METTPEHTPLQKNLLRSFDEIIERIDFKKVSDFTGKPVDELRTSARLMLASALNRFPDIVGSCSNGWNLNIFKDGIGCYRVKVHYQVTSGSSLVFDAEETKRAHKLGLIDDEGDSVYPPPACHICGQKLPEAAVSQEVAG